MSRHHPHSRECGVVSGVVVVRISFIFNLGAVASGEDEGLCGVATSGQGVHTVDYLFWHG